jgi:hypothetical protein
MSNINDKSNKAGDPTMPPPPPPEPVDGVMVTVRVTGSAVLPAKSVTL